MRVKFVVCVLCVAVSVSLAAQPASVDPAQEIKSLTERLNTLIKTSAQKDAELEKLRQAVASQPANVEKAIESRVGDLEKFKAMPIVKACKAAKGKALITNDVKGGLVYTGCLL